MALTATAQPTSTPPQVRLQITGRGTSTATVQVVRVRQDGSTETVRGVVRLAAGGGLTYDLQAPYGEPVTYRTVEATPEVSGAVTLSPTRAWLVHPFYPSLSTPLLGDKGDPRVQTDAPVLVADAFSEETLDTSSAGLDVLNRDDPIVQRTGRRRRRSGNIALRVTTQTQDDTIRGLVNDDQAVLLNVPLSLGWGMTSTWMLLGSLTRTRRSQSGATDTTAVWSGEWTAVQPPAGRSLPQWSCGDVLDTYATCGDVEQAFRTCGDLEANMPIVMMT